ncbi:transposase [Streptomyces sp. NPDC006430]|uniref:transposase n=1 Tax=Streptomyces sp. NPDC006430 TaxID=3154299 RepID=UPI0033B5F30A
MLDAIRYLVAGGISWRAMPADFPDGARVYAFFRRWRENGLVLPVLPPPATMPVAER